LCSAPHHVAEWHVLLHLISTHAAPHANRHDILQ
jgi:hypothetical protein